MSRSLKQLIRERQLVHRFGVPLWLARTGWGRLYPAPQTGGSHDLPADLPLVLVIDDDPSIREILAELLRFEGYRVATAANGAEGLMALERERPSLILLDMRMPVLDGWGFARAVREHRLDVPILVMTAATSARKWAEEVGADGYVGKPFDFGELLECVERFRER